MTYNIGTSGFVYGHWASVFYPEDLPQEKWFAYYAERFHTVEINNTFYNLPERCTFKSWKEQAPDGFHYAVKASRYMTHMKKLKDPQETWQTFWERARVLEDRLGPVLFQLPPHWRCNPKRLAGFLDVLPAGLDAVIEFRDPSWYCDEVFDFLDNAGATLCVHDMEGSASPKRAAGDLAYCRFHGSEGAYRGRYGKNRLRPWARWIGKQAEQEGRRVYAYFNNDQEGYAVKDALALRELLGE